MYNNRNGAISWSLSKLYKSRPLAFFASSHRFPDIYFDLQKICVLKIIGQGHDMQHSQRRLSMVNVNLHRSRSRTFFVSSYSFPDIIYFMISRNSVTLKYMSKSHIQHTQRETG